MLDDGRIQCDVCPRACKLNEGQRGLCFVRARQDDQVVLTSYGRPSGFCVDPIEKRDWYTLLSWNLTGDGHCGSCGATCAGIFDGPPGDWGAKRQAVSLRTL